MILKINDRIRNRKVDFFTKFNLNLQFDSVGSVFSFSYFFDPNNAEHKELSCIGHYHTCTIEHEGQLLLTGQILTPKFKSSPEKNLVTVSGYSLPGVLEDCQIPVKYYPLECDNLSLAEVAKRFVDPFGIGIVIDAAVASRMNEKFGKTTAQPTETVKGYLQSLATQKNIVISHNQYGNLVFTEAKPNRKAIIDFNVPAKIPSTDGSPAKGGIPGTEFELEYNGQAIHSEITVIKQASKRKQGNAAQATVYNPYVPYVYRPRVVTQDSGDDIDTELAAKHLRAQELKNVKLIVNTDRWIVNGKVITPNNVITVTNPEIYLYKKTRWFIETVILKGDAQSATASLHCVPEEVYNNQEPNYIWKGINNH